MATLYAYSPNGTQATLSYEVIGFTQSLEQNGWCKLPNGLIFQWRFKSDITSSSGLFKIFNIIMNISSTLFIALGVAHKTNGNYDGIITNNNNSSLSIYGSNINGCTYFMIGY